MSAVVILGLLSFALVMFAHDLKLTRRVWIVVVAASLCTGTTMFLFDPSEYRFLCALAACFALAAGFPLANAVPRGSGLAIVVSLIIVSVAAYLVLAHGPVEPGSKPLSAGLVLLCAALPLTLRNYGAARERFLNPPEEPGRKPPVT